jgi:hypothetical protein
LKCAMFRSATVLSMAWLRLQPHEPPPARHNSGCAEEGYIIEL